MLPADIVYLMDLVDDRLNHILKRIAALETKERRKTVRSKLPVQQTHGAGGKVAHIAALESYGNEMSRRGLRNEAAYYHEIARQRRHA